MPNRKGSSLVSVFFIAAFAATLGLKNARAETLGFSVSDDGTSGNIQIAVVDEATGQPISDAVVTVRDALTDAEAEASGEDAFALTDSDGAALIRPFTSRAKNVTVSKRSYSSISVLGLQGNHLTIFLKQLATQTRDVIASGTVGGWPLIRKARGWRGKPVYAGLVFRALNGFDLLSFDINSVISPLKDTIDVWGERKIPSNISLPKQKIPVFLGSITVEKYNYRFPLTAGRDARLSLVQGWINSGDLIDLAQSGKFTAAAINKFTFTRIGLSQPTTPTGDFAQNINASYEVAPTYEVAVSAAPFRSDVLLAAVTDVNGDRQSLVPTDIRAPITLRRFRAAPVTVQMRSTTQALGSHRDVFAVALSEDKKRLSGVIARASGTKVVPGEFLNVNALPDSATLPPSVQLPAARQGLNAVVFESAVEIPEERGSTGPRERRFPVWYVYTLPTAGAVQVPTQQMPVPADIPVRGYSLLQLEFSSDFNERAIDGRTAMTGLQRFTRASSFIGSIRHRHRRY